jgi:hypothetical protein
MKTNVFLLPIVSALLLIALPVMAQEESAEAAKSKIRDSTTVTVTVTTAPEMQATVSEHIVIPVMQFDNPLFSGNNLNIGLSANFTPITLDGTVDLTWTPIAFIQIFGGATLGSGWNWPGLGDGLGRNERTGGIGSPGHIVGDPFEALVWKVYWGGVFQFDLAAVLPGDWNHVVVQTRQEVNYRAYTGVDDNVSWLYKADNGENRNGFNYYASYVLGYQMPASPILKMVGIMAEMDQYLYNTANRESWGDNLGRWTISGLFDFEITKWLGATFLIQVNTKRNYNDPGDSEFAKALKPFYQDRDLVDANPLRLNFSKFVFLFNFRLR